MVSLEGGLVKSASAGQDFNYSTHKPEQMQNRVLRPVLVSNSAGSEHSGDADDSNQQ